MNFWDELEKNPTALKVDPRVTRKARKRTLQRAAGSASDAQVQQHLSDFVNRPAQAKDRS